MIEPWWWSTVEYFLWSLHSDRINSITICHGHRNNQHFSNYIESILCNNYIISRKHEWPFQYYFVLVFKAVFLRFYSRDCNGSAITTTVTAYRMSTMRKESAKLDRLQLQYSSGTHFTWNVCGFYLKHL